jgi:hypothetical protein
MGNATGDPGHANIATTHPRPPQPDFVDALRWLTRQAWGLWLRLWK